MTERKDFKRFVRDRAQRTGESYSSALRNVRNARPAGSAAPPRASSSRGELSMPVAITRTIPDVRSTHIDKTIRFYTQLLGFDVRREGDEVTAFVSATHPDVEVTLNHAAFALPPGFVVEVATIDDVRAVSERAEKARVRIVGDLDAHGRQFSMLDPSGSCLTIASAELRPHLLPARRGTTDTIAAALPAVLTNDLAATRAFYVDVIGLDVAWERDGRMLLRSAHAERPALTVSSTSTGDHAGAGFNLNVASIERVESLYRAALGNWIVMYEPMTVEQVGIRGFAVLDPSAASIYVYTPLHHVGRG
jgi:catechol 2,3-dioxygenase-like lactoylglutathione lyase family enzyme